MLPALCQHDERGDISDPWQTSNYLAMYNPFFNSYRQGQISWFSFAQHVAMENRWQLRDQADSYQQSDFNLKYKPQGLQSHASAVDAKHGLGTGVGEVLTIPAVQHQHADGTVSARKAFIKIKCASQEKIPTSKQV